MDRERIGVIWGSGIGGLKTFQDECINFGRGDGTPRFNPFFIPKMIADSAAGLISMRHVLHGPSYVTASACASEQQRHDRCLQLHPSRHLCGRGDGR